MQPSDQLEHTKRFLIDVVVELTEVKNELSETIKELTSVKSELSEKKEQLCRANILIRQLAIRTTPLLSTPSHAHSLAQPLLISLPSLYPSEHL